MQIVIDPRGGHPRMGARTLEVDKFYDVDDEHRIIFRAIGHGGTIFQLKRGKVTVQTVVIPRVNANAGRSYDGEPMPQVFTVNIVPGKPIFQQGDVAKRVIAAGVPWSSVHILNEGQTLRELVAAHSSPTMVCDDESALRTEMVPAHGDLMRGVSFTVDPSARWAIRGREGTTDISAVYLWPGAADDIDNLLAHIAGD